MRKFVISDDPGHLETSSLKEIQHKNERTLVICDTLPIDPESHITHIKAAGSSNALQPTAGRATIHRSLHPGIRRASLRCNSPVEKMKMPVAEFSLPVFAGAVDTHVHDERLPRTRTPKNE
jgi:hypothetical protein